MTLFRPSRRGAGESNVHGVPLPGRVGPVKGKVSVTNDSALRVSALWACVRLRADLISTMPVDVFKRINGYQVEMPKSTILIDTGGQSWPYDMWMWASQADLDKVGNTIGLITEKNALGLPNRIELAPITSVTVKRVKGVLKYVIDNVTYDADQVWHERQFPAAGLDVGLSPIAYAAWALGEYMNIQEFALDWFSGSAVPKAMLRNSAKKVENREALMMKERFRATVANGDLFVAGHDWEYKFLQAEAMGSEWLDAKRYGLTEICRFFGCPADVIDAAVSGGGSITYQNITQQNLQYLIHHLQPAITRRELRLSTLLPLQRYVKLNTDALLRMDPEMMANVIAARIEARTMTNTEAREKYNLPPLTQDQVDEFTKLYGPPKTMPTATPMKGRGLTQSVEVYGRMLEDSYVTRR